MKFGHLRSEIWSFEVTLVYGDTSIRVWKSKIKLLGKYNSYFFYKEVAFIRRELEELSMKMVEVLFSGIPQCRKPLIRAKGE